MASFFEEAPVGDSAYRWGQSEANRRIYLLAAKILQQPLAGMEGSLNKGLQLYCANFLMMHFNSIDLEDHTAPEKAEVMETLATTMSGKSHLQDILGTDEARTYCFQTVDTHVLAQWADSLTPEEFNSLLSSGAAQ